MEQRRQAGGVTGLQRCLEPGQPIGGNAPALLRRFEFAQGLGVVAHRTLLNQPAFLLLRAV